MKRIKISLLIVTLTLALMTAEQAVALTSACEAMLDSNLIVDGWGTLGHALDCIGSGAGAFIEALFDVW
jgi:hypothetical protein